jgi:hypothetical protein
VSFAVPGADRLTDAISKFCADRTVSEISKRAEVFSILLIFGLAGHATIVAFVRSRSNTLYVERLPNSVYNGWRGIVRHSKLMAKTAMKLVFAAMLALLATQAAAPTVRAAAVLEIVWLAQCPAQNPAQRKAQQQAPRKIQRTARDTPGRRQSQTYVSLVASGPDVVLMYQLPPPTSSFAS